MTKTSVRLALMTLVLAITAMASPPNAGAVFGSGCQICPECHELTGEDIYDGFQQCNPDYRIYFVVNGTTYEYTTCRSWNPCIQTWIPA